MTYQPKTYRKQGGDTFVVVEDGWIELPRVARSTTDTSALPNQGICLLTGSSTSPVFALPSPIGSWLYIKCVGVGASGDAIVSSTVDINSGKNRLKFDAAAEAVTLAGTSTGWHIVSNVGSVATTSG